MNPTTAKTKVIFRIFRTGEVIALFPAIAATQCAGHCLSYQHIGQHGAASVDLSHCCRLATPEEYTALADELCAAGYVLDIRKRCTARDYRERYAQLAA